MKYLMIPLAALAVILSGLAHAADMRQPVPYMKAVPALELYSWSGLYFTGYAQYGANFTNQTTQALGASIDLGAAPHGPGLGGSLSLLYQLPASPWVLGLRADMSWANLQGTGALATGGNALLVSNATNYLGSLNGIFGYTLGSDQKLLAYLTGGAGFGGAKPNLQVNGLAQGLSDTSIGYDIGGGLAYALSPNWSMFIEGDYFKLGGKSVTIPSLGVTSNAAYDIFMQKAGFSFRLP
ncbi:MAG TPA: outer membrane beta-barrel protein [Steroidobacteraceae bacterium]|nr:outer membrane beta-barrel protein [Steroidobacteraceae bacterium]